MSKKRKIIIGVIAVFILAVFILLVLIGSGSDDTAEVQEVAPTAVPTQVPTSTPEPTAIPTAKNDYWKQAFMESCASDVALTDYCSCTYDALRQDYTLQELIEELEGLSEDEAANFVMPYAIQCSEHL